MALDINADIVSAFGDINLTPTTFLVSSEGSSSYRKVGKIDFDGRERESWMPLPATSHNRLP